MNFPITNNKTEYEAFIVELQSASKLKVLELHIFSDSKLMPYALAFEFEAVIPLEVGLPIIQIETYDISHNEEVLARDLDLTDK